MNPGLPPFNALDLPTLLFSTETDRAKGTHTYSLTHKKTHGLCRYVDLVVD